MRNGRALREDERERIVTLWEEGETFTAIAAAIGRGRTTTRRYLCSAGLYQPPRPRSAAEEARIIAWYGDGRPVSHILRRFGIRESTLYGILHAAGEPLRYPNMSAAAKLRSRRSQEATAP